MRWLRSQLKYLQMRVVHSLTVPVLFLRCFPDQCHSLKEERNEEGSESEALRDIQRPLASSMVDIVGAARRVERWSQGPFHRLRDWHCPLCLPYSHEAPFPQGSHLDYNRKMPDLSRGGQYPQWTKDRDNWFSIRNDVLTLSRRAEDSSYHET